MSHSKVKGKDGDAATLQWFAVLVIVAVAAIWAIVSTHVTPSAHASGIGASDDTVTAIDVMSIPPCPIADGPGNGPVPCAYDSRTGMRAWPYPGKQWVVYVERCPVPIVQAADSQCVGRDDWSGGVH